MNHTKEIWVEAEAAETDETLNPEPRVGLLNSGCQGRQLIAILNS